MYYNKRKSQGFSLIEVLVSVVIFAIGILGLIAMYFTAIKSQADARYRSAITTSMSSMMDRIVANPDGAFVGAGGYKTAYGTAAPSASTCATYKTGAVFTALPAFNNKTLKSVELAAAEAQAFRDEIGCTLPAGDVDIQPDMAPTPGQPACSDALVPSPDIVTIRVRWSDTRSEAQTGGSTTNAQFECYTLSMRVARKLPQI